MIVYFFLFCFSRSMIKPILGLKYPPVNRINKALPEKLIFINNKGYGFHSAKIFEIKTPSNKCNMHFIESRDFQPNDNKKTLYIALLISEPRKIGLGKDLLNFAKIYSKQIGCEGRISLTAEKLYKYSEAPHTFYKKNGMNTGFPEIDAKLDEFVKEGKIGTKEDFPSIDMYYPPIEFADKYLESLKTKPKTFQERILDKFKNLWNRLF